MERKSTTEPDQERALVGRSLKGRSTLVTGASSGIGRALTFELVRKGARVVAVARSAEKLAGLAEEIGDAVLPFAADITDEASVRELAGVVHREFGVVDAVVNNAGIGRLEPFLSSTRPGWQEVVDTNLLGALLVAHAFLPAMLERGRGVIVNVGSSGAAGWPYMTLYAASKAALHAASVSLDREYSGRGVRILSVEVESTAGTEFSAAFDPGHFAEAMGLWTELGIPWDSPVTMPEESARRILRAIEAALE